VCNINTERSETEPRPGRETTDGVSTSARAGAGAGGRKREAEGATRVYVTEQAVGRDRGVASGRTTRRAAGGQRSSSWPREDKPGGGRVLTEPRPLVAESTATSLRQRAPSWRRALARSTAHALIDSPWPGGSSHRPRRRTRPSVSAKCSGDNSIGSSRPPQTRRRRSSSPQAQRTSRSTWRYATRSGPRHSPPRTLPAHSSAA
jgi:hypothetical protein